MNVPIAWPQLVLPVLRMAHSQNSSVRFNAPRSVELHRGHLLSKRLIPRGIATPQISRNLPASGGGALPPPVARTPEDVSRALRLYWASIFFFQKAVSRKSIEKFLDGVLPHFPAADLPITIQGSPPSRI